MVKLSVNASLRKFVPRLVAVCQVVELAIENIPLTPVVLFFTDIFPVQFGDTVNCIEVTPAPLFFV